MDASDIVVSSKKVKKRQSDQLASLEAIEEAKKLSKRAKKRIEQIANRKEKESKQAEYLATLSKHSISDKHRELLTSTRDIGQTLSIKKRLRVILRRHQAGIALTPDEQELLFPSMNAEEIASYNAPSSNHFQSDNILKDLVSLNRSETGRTDQNPTQISFSSSSTTAATPKPAKAVSLGSSLLQQFSKLKSGILTASKPTPAASTSSVFASVCTEGLASSADFSPNPENGISRAEKYISGNDTLLS